ARPVTIVVPFAAGGSTDVSARIVGEYMARTLRQQFLIEKVPGEHPPVRGLCSRMSLAYFNVAQREFTSFFYPFRMPRNAFDEREFIRTYPIRRAPKLKKTST